MQYKGKNVDGMSDTDLVAASFELENILVAFREKQGRKRFTDVVKDAPINPAFVAVQKAVSDEITKRKLAK